MQSITKPVVIMQSITKPVVIKQCVTAGARGQAIHMGSGQSCPAPGHRKGAVKHGRASLSR
jgi:hypothetical protein